MNELDCGAGDRHSLAVSAGQLAPRKCQQRADALTATEHRISHGTVQPLGEQALRRKDLLEDGFNTTLPGGGPSLEMGHVHHCSAGPKLFSTFSSRILTCCCASWSAPWQNLSSSAPRLYAASDCSSGICPASMLATIFSSSVRAASKVGWSGLLPAVGISEKPDETQRVTQPGTAGQRSRTRGIGSPCQREALAVPHADSRFERHRKTEPRLFLRVRTDSSDASRAWHTPDQCEL